MGFSDHLARMDQAVRARAGGSVIYSPAAGDPVTVDGIFDATYQHVDLQSGVSSSGPAVFLTLSELPSNPVTDLTATVTVDGVTYRPHTRKPDGQGAILLMLHRV